MPSTTFFSTPKFFRKVFSVFMALFLSALVVHNAKGVMTESSPEWSKAHPSYKKYQKLVEEEKWQQAADLLRKFDTSQDPYYYFEKYADVYRQAGDVAAGLAQLEQRLRVLAQNPNILTNQHTTLLDEMRSTAYFAKLWGSQINLRSKFTIINAIVLYYNDDFAGAFAMAERVPKDELGADQKIEFQNQIALRAWDMSNTNADWPAAAAIAAYIKEHKISDIYTTYSMRLNEIAMSCEKAGDLPLAQHFLEASIANYYTDEEKIQRAKTVAAFAKKHDLHSDHWLVKSMLLHESGQTLAAMKLLRSQEDSSGFDYLKEILRPAFDQAYAKSDWATAAHIAGYSIKITPPPDGEFLYHILEAIEKSGKPELAIEFCLNSLWVRNLSFEKPHTCDPQGDPELVKRAAEIAQRHQISPKDELVAAWLLHLQGKSGEAHEQIFMFLTNLPTAKDLPCQVSVARFLMGDIALAQNNLIRALTCYNLSTYYFTEFLAKYKGAEFYVPAYDSHYHEALGITRQVDVLVRMGKPDLAEEDMKGLLQADPSLENTIALNTTLKTKWQEAAALIEKARQSGVTNNPSYAEDIIRVNGEARPRLTAMKRIPYYRKKLAATGAQIRREEAQRSLAERQKREAEAQAATEVRASSVGAKNFVDSYVAEQERLQQEKAAAAENANTPLPDAPSRPALRRCASCLGSGKAGYVTGSKFQSTTTGQTVAAPDCSACGGTGWR